MESIWAVIFTLILLFPLIVQLQMLIADPKKLFSIFHYYASSGQDDAGNNSSPQLLQYYPKGPVVFDSRSESKMMLTNLRTASSSPVLSGAASITEPEKPIASRLPEARHSSTFRKTGEVLPVVDITWNYNSYRYKAFEACLRNRYGSRYPPAEVVLNSMQLNLLDSSVNVSLAAGLLDFVKESDPALNGSVSRKLEIEYLNPLDHFVTRRLRKPLTAERFTEMLFEQEDRASPSRDANSNGDPIRPVINDREKNGWINRRSHGKIEPVCKRNSSSMRRVYDTHDFQPKRNVPSTENSPPSRLRN